MSDSMARRRVKLYTLNTERQWDDKGTGHVTSAYVEKLKGMSLLVREENDGCLLLESKIMPYTVYQKQQGTLIVWSEGENIDFALSFQEKSGCSEIWEKICQVQGKDPSLDVTNEESEDEKFEEDPNLIVNLPPCELSKLETICTLINEYLSTPLKRDRLAFSIEKENYIKKLIELFNMCEDLENKEGLHLLYDIFKNIFLLNKSSIYDILLADDVIFDVVGALEYDPKSPKPKRHRQFLKSRAKFKEVISIKNKELLSKIHQTYRVQYIQDVVLPTPPVFEENMLSTLSSFIYFNKVEIVTLIQEDERFLSELFHQLSSAEDEISLSRRQDLVLFLKEFCTFSQTLQPVPRESFFKTLSTLGVLSTLEITLSLNHQVIKSASMDILSFIVEYSPTMVREYMMQQQNKVEEDQYLLNIMIEQMVLDTDPEMGGAVQLMGVLRILVDPENMLPSVSVASKSERIDFLTFFYKHSMCGLIAPLLSNTLDNEVGAEDYQTAQLLALILELLAFCVECHTYHIKNYIVNRDLLSRILVLMKSKHTFLVLSALRFMRKIVGMKDEFYNRHILAANLFSPVVDAFVRNNGRYNLLDSAIIELFEFIRLEELKPLIAVIVEKFGDVLSKVNYVHTFQSLRRMYERNKDAKQCSRAYETFNLNFTVTTNMRPGTGGGMAATTALGGTGVNRFRRDVRDMDAEEELWFNCDDEEANAAEAEEGIEADLQTATNASADAAEGKTGQAEGSPPTPAGGAVVAGEDKIDRELGVGEGATPAWNALINSTKEAADVAVEAVAVAEEANMRKVVVPARMMTASSKKVSLVDYDANSDEDEEEENEDEEADVSLTPPAVVAPSTGAAAEALPEDQEETSPAEDETALPDAEESGGERESASSPSSSSCSAESSEAEADAPQQSREARPRSPPPVAAKRARLDEEGD